MQMKGRLYLDKLLMEVTTMEAFFDFIMELFDKIKTLVFDIIDKANGK